MLKHLLVLIVKLRGFYESHISNVIHLFYLKSCECISLVRLKEEITSNHHGIA